MVVVKAEERAEKQTTASVKAENFMVEEVLLLIRFLGIVQQAKVRRKAIESVRWKGEMDSPTVHARGGQTSALLPRGQQVRI